MIKSRIPHPRRYSLRRMQDKFGARKRTQQINLMRAMEV